MYKLYTLYSLELGWVELKLTVTAMQRAKEMGIVTASETAMQTPMVTQTAREMVTRMSSRAPQPSN
tara:strand:- start:1039 stop:1236 length:198 start_codon:yes stop_codon:yes gene_type:complete